MSAGAQPTNARWSIDGSAVACVRELYLTIRVSTLGFTLLLPLLGAVSAQRTLTASSTLALIAVGVSFHIFAYVFNDVVDLPLDRTEPMRADSPLVRGTLNRSTALWLALPQLPIGFALALLAGASPLALTLLGAAFAGLAIYDLYGKRCRWPLLTDVIEAVGFCALVLFGTCLVGDPQEDTPWLLGIVFVYVLLITGVHGSVRDLANDYARGAQTTAIWLGARPAEESAVRLPGALIVYAFVLQGTLTVLTLFALESQGLDHGSYWSTALPVMAALVAGTVLLILLLRGGQRREMMRFGVLHTVLSMLVMPALYLSVLNAASLAILAAVFAVPVAAMYLYNGSHWRV
jgi:4-hydroxybenzoate polyprenyltransferase